MAGEAEEWQFYFTLISINNPLWPVANGQDGEGLEAGGARAQGVGLGLHMHHGFQ